jgi:acyl-CoA reductase-like NAD-dependent aldehyde dehydrogenase
MNHSDFVSEPLASGKFLISGEWIAASETVPVRNPANVQEEVGRTAICSQGDVLAAIESAHAAFLGWRLTPLDDRIARIRAAATHLATVAVELTRLFVRENGKVWAEAEVDVRRSIEVLSGATACIEAWFKGEMYSGQQTVNALRRPRGVTAVISPWNSPVILTFKRVIPAILTGNTVVLKPPSYCPLTISEAMRILASHLPDGVINIVSGPGHRIGEVLCTHPAVKTISFIGSTETGKRILQWAAPTLKKVYLELGGNDPAILLPDVTLDESTLRALRTGILRAAGQVCSAIKRVYVHRSRFVELVEKMTKSFQEVKVGNGLLPEAMMGPLNNQAQYEFVKGLIEDAQRQNHEVIQVGQVLEPDRWDDGYFILPTIVTGVRNEDMLVQCEQFGPVIPIVPYDDLEEAIAFANGSEFGLRASIWGRDLTVARELSQRLEAGGVFFNQHSVFQDLKLDFPGVKWSGVGRETAWGNFELFCDTYGFAYMS